MPAAIIVAHGAPADPDPQDLVLHDLARRVGEVMPDWDIRGATLAREGSLDCALSGLQDPLIYPFFMAEGWFTKRELPRRLAELGFEGLTHLDPLGVDPDLPDLIAKAALQAAEDAGITSSEAHLLLAAHGSKVSSKSKDASYAMADILKRWGGFRDVSVGLIEEAPFLAEAAANLGQAVCVPFFALRAGHVVGDLPEALEEAEFAGPCLDPIGEHPQIPHLIAAALKRAGP
ncbi:CbiX/SirB N-terminal domain-containing protein [Albirhodobacter sp. R86504]|jgi:sirohydrochlorin ferrochelatase|uniref:CbiX/SirB N-terminal domain-containing protein n=1 Tax=Albirhodobacter sp. R86504 TaxID=3093848 RepID=UPI003671ED42